eukprot:gene2019-2521_t
MADGTATTGSTMLGGSLNTLLKYFPLHFMLYSNTGSAQGWQEIGVNRRLALPGEVETNAVTPNDVLIDGFLDWMKIPQAVYTRSYVDGIPLHVLTSIGERNDPPASGEIILNFPATSNNAVADFYQGGSGKVCYVLTVPDPKQLTPANVDHCDIFFLVTQRP